MNRKISAVAKAMPAFVLAACLLVFAGGCSADDDELTLTLSESDEDGQESISQDADGTDADDGDLSDDEGADGNGVADGDEICVYVCGQVNDPGVYTLSSGSRIYEAIELAGGFTSDAAEESLNLADVLEDGQQITVWSVEEYEAGLSDTSASSSGTDSGDGLININTATADELTELPGIGDVKAAAIVAYREANGSFSSIEDIMNVDGIKEGSYEKIKDLITV